MAEDFLLFPDVGGLIPTKHLPKKKKSWFLLLLVGINIFIIDLDTWPVENHVFKTWYFWKFVAH